MAVGVRDLLIAAVLTTLGLMLTIFSCTLIPGKNAWPLLPFLFYGFGVVPLFLCSGNAQPSFDGSASMSQGFYSLGHFFVGMCLASGPCMSLVQYHTDMITGTALGLSLGSVAFLAGAMYVLFRAFAKPEDETAF